MLLAPGTAVSAKLTLVRLLGEGAMGSVWVADSVGSPRPVAVKFLAARPSRDALARFQREASAASKLESPNVVRIFDHGATEDGTPYIVMELLEGETLGERLTRVGRLGLDDVAAIVRQIATALDAAHRLGIVHRDIKPDNIFIVGADDFPLVKLLDFGMAKQTDGTDPTSELTAMGVAVGTPEYMSPEQVLGGRDVDHRSDLWALGVVAYRALAGVPPFDGASPHALFFAICRGAYRPLEEVGLAAPFDRWFQSALSPKKTNRFDSGRALVSEFDLVLREVRALEDASTNEALEPTGEFDAFALMEAATATSAADAAATQQKRAILAAPPLEPDLRIDEWITESMSMPPTDSHPGETSAPGVFERASQRGAIAVVVRDELASLEETPSSAPSSLPERRGRASLGVVAFVILVLAAVAAVFLRAR